MKRILANTIIYTIGQDTDVEVGHGLIKVDSALVPFERNFPKNTELYKLMSTKIGE